VWRYLLEDGIVLLSGFTLAGMGISNTEIVV